MTEGDITMEALKFLRTQAKNTNARLDSVQADVAVLQKDVAVLKTDVALLKTDVAELKTDVAELKTDVRGLGTRLTETEIRLWTEIVAVAGAIREVREILLEDRAARSRPRRR